jgi:hypothetical protein
VGIPKSRAAAGLNTKKISRNRSPWMMPILNADAVHAIIREKKIQVKYTGQTL